MTNEKQDLLIAYRVDAGELYPDGDLEEEFQDWYRVREGQVSGEAHYKAVLEIWPESLDQGDEFRQ